MLRKLLLIMLISGLNLSIGLVGEISFKNGKITYANSYDNEYSQGEIVFGENQIFQKKLYIKIIGAN